MWITFGLYLMTALYIGVVVAAKYVPHVDCLDELCQSEGVDNTILNWASEFFVAFWIFVFALHLSVYVDPRKKEIRKAGILAQAFMGGAFAMNGLGDLLYPNSGMDDNHSMLGYWVVQIACKVFFTMSGLAMSHFALFAAKHANPDLKLNCCARFYLVALCELLLLLSFTGYLTGSIWCSSEPDLQAYDVIDNFEEVMNNDDDLVEKHVCFRIANSSETAINISYALLWLPVGTLLKAASHQRPLVIMGLPTPIAAGVAVTLQCTAGSVLLVIFSCVDALAPTKADYFEAWNKVYATVLYHWAMLLTMFCLHNLSYGLPSNIDENYANETGLFSFSGDWWESIANKIWPEPEEEYDVETAECEDIKEYDVESKNRQIQVKPQVKPQVNSAPTLARTRSKMSRTPSWITGGSKSSKTSKTSKTSRNSKNSRVTNRHLTTRNTSDALHPYDQSRTIQTKKSSDDLTVDVVCCTVKCNP